MAISIYFRTDDGTKWGTGIGTRLTSSQVDLNFWNLKQAVEQLQTDLPDAAVGVADFTVSGDEFYVILTDDTTLGPYTLPVVVWTFKGAWLADTAYNTGDVVSYGSAIYLVTFVHTSGVTFDPGANDGQGNNYYSLMLDIGSYNMAAGGTTGQYLAKNSNADFDSTWKTMPLPQHSLVNGAVSGDITVTGIAIGDRLDEVIYYPINYGVYDLTSEFSIVNTDTISNTGGTSTAGGKLMVRWTKLT